MTKDELEDAFRNEGRESYVVRETTEPASQRTYELDERPARCAEAIIDFANIISRVFVGDSARCDLRVLRHRVAAISKCTQSLAAHDRAVDHRYARHGDAAGHPPG